MHVAIVGFATEGIVSAAYFAEQGHIITICDQDDDLDIPPSYEKQLGVHYLDNLDRFDVIVRSAGIPPRVILERNPTVDSKITTAVNEFFAQCPSPHTIGITGTKGKGTTCTLTAQMLAAAGKKVWLGGNIGRSPLEFIHQISPDDWVVIECSSFQLIDLTHSPHIATCLMVVPEHLNWHADLAEYLEAKSQLFAGQAGNDIAISYHDNERSKMIAAAGAGRKLTYGAAPMARVEGDAIVIESMVVCHVNEVRLLGRFNLQNICAAITTVWQAGVHDIRAMHQVITSFTGLPHHLEFVREVEGVKYYDDSFGTTPETAIAAMESFSAPKIMILGGSNKGANYDELAAKVDSSNVRHVVLIGDEAARIQEQLDHVGFTAYSHGGNTMAEIIAACKTQAQPGDIVLLSTGCASFGLFTNYKDRGLKFKAAVRAL